MGKKAKKEIKSIDDIEVKLRPIGKIRPGVYLTVLYALAVILLVFFFLFLPGIRKHGAEVTFVSVPDQCAVYIDGKLAGVTPFQIFVSSGKRQIEFKKLHFQTAEKIYTVPGRLFGSLIFPKKDAVAVKLSIDSPEKLLETAFAEYVNWSGIGNFHSRYQPPPILSETVRSVYISGGVPKGDTESQEILRDFLIGCMEYSSDEVLLKDLLHAYLLTCTKGRPLTASSVTAALQGISAVFDEFPNLPFWLASQLSEEGVESLTRNQWYIGRLRAYEEVLKKAGDETADLTKSMPSGRDEIVLDSLNFVPIPGGTYVLGDVMKNAFPVVFSTERFYIAADEVSCLQYGKFLEENPQYRPENRAQLVEAGKVSEDYLQDWDTQQGSSLPVSSVSYYAASAYCSWLETKLPAGIRESFTVRLPYEYEWETAAFFSETEDAVLFETGIEGPRPVGRSSSAQTGAGRAAVTNMYGNLWEWCENWYGVHNFVYYDWDGNYKNKESYPALEKSVRGGSWSVMQELVTVHSRGSQPARWCTPFLGFRPVLVQK